MSMELPTTPAPATRPCPHCQQGVPCFRPQQSQYFGCPNCRCYFSARPGQPGQVEAEPRQLKPGPPPALPLGSVGTFGGYRLRITGYQRRGEKADPLAVWGEYQLSPADEQAEQAAAADPYFPLQLAEYQGHWLLIRPAKAGPKRVPDDLGEWNDPSDGQRAFRLWHRYRPRLLELQGEFDYNVLEDEKLNIVELTGPPYQLLGEVKPGKSYTWYRGKYLEPARVAAAFGLAPGQLPRREGIGAAQPPPGNISWGRLAQLTGAGLFVLLLVQALLVLRPAPVLLEAYFDLAGPAVASIAPNDTTSVAQQRQQLRVRRDSLLARTYNAPGAPPLPSELALSLMSAREEIKQQYEQQLAALEQAAQHAPSPAPSPPPGLPLTFVSGNFLLDGRTALSLTLDAPYLDNSWVEVSLSLINEQTGRAYEATRALEFYSGVEGGESWREGNRTADIDFNAVPAGRYHVNLYPVADPSRPGAGQLRLRVAPDHGLWGNFWLALLVLGLPLVLLGIRRSFFESARWRNSDYGPRDES